MTEKQSQKIFEKHNPADAVTRCPNGRAPVRKLLDAYARAAVNLYGVISKAELAEIFNRQNTSLTNPDEVFTLLLPLVLKQKWYCFYKDFIVHYLALDDFDYADDWLRQQGDKPRYIPEKEEFLRYGNQYYECETQRSYWSKLHDFISETWPDNPEKYRLYHEVKDFSAFSPSVSKTAELLEEYGMAFKGEKQAQRFFSLLMEACNNTRLWSNKGYMPSELHQLLESRRPKTGAPEIILQPRIKVGANDPCPCGSGKKYKKCCRLTEQAKTAQLSYSECTLFYETWYGLMGFINREKKLVNAVIKPKWPNPISDELVYKVREVLWENPALISDYINSTALTEEQVKILKSWRDHHKKGMFYLVDYKPEYAIAIGPNEENEDRLYAIKGISRSLADAMQRQLPTQFETVLLPFGDKIIYDGFMSTMAISFGEGVKKMFMEMYEGALVHGVMTTLGE